MNIAESFKDLESKQGEVSIPGTFERRLHSKNGCDLFVGVRKPGNLRTFRVRFSQSVSPKLTDLPRFKDMELSHSSSSEDGKNYFIIQLRLSSSTFNDVFTCLVDDVACHISTIFDENAAAEAFIARLTKWQRFLEHYRPDGLSPEEQRGLFGELWFLLYHLCPVLSPLNAVNAWTGPSGAAKDFHIGSTAVEIKTTVTKQHQNIQIQSEKQLDDNGLTALFLYHLSLEQSQGAGNSLPELVHQMRSNVSQSSAESELEDKLRDYGYLDIHESRYHGSRYSLREENLFRVKEDFPRIVEHDLRSGVGEVRYSVSVAECRHFTVNFAELHKELSEAQ